MAMHPETKALLLAAIRVEVQGDPAGLGYAGKTPAEVADLLNAPIVVQAPLTHRDVSISDVEGYLRARLLVTRLRSWAANADAGTPREAAWELLDIIASPRLMNFSTSTDSGRANILGLFGLLVQAGAGGLTAQHLADLTAMTMAPAGPPVLGPARWLVIIEGISAAPTPEPTQNEDGTETQHPGYAGPPNAADEPLVAEALA